MTVAISGEPIYSTLGDDEDLAELVELFVAEVPDRIAALLAAADEGNWDQVGRLAHQIKGAAGSYGFGDVTPIADRLEKRAKAHATPEELLEGVQKLVGLCGRLRAGAPG